MVTPLGVREAAARLGGRRGGLLLDDLGVAFGRPILVVDLDTGGAPVDLDVPVELGAVVVGVTAGRSDVAPEGYDVLLSGDRDAPAPWVGCDDVTVASRSLAAAVVACPLAATALVTLLRAGAGLSRRTAVAVESSTYAMLQAGPEHAGWLARLARPAPDGGTGEPVLLERDRGTLHVVLDRPARRNAYGAAMRDGLVAALALAATDPEGGPVHLRGRGPCFSAGGDLAEFGTLRDPASAHAVRMARHAGLWLDRLSARTTAFVHGTCVGAGVELAAFASTVVADPATTVRLPEVGMGLVPGAGGTASVTHRVGRERTAWLALSGEPIDAATARRWGLVDVLAPVRGT